jgi:carbamoyl-phosphate synthase large subunit
MLKGKRVFVSGGAGVIGTELVSKLHQLGAEIFVGDLKSKPAEWSQDIKYWQGDLNYITKEELDAFNPEYFFHLAATFERSVETYEFWSENDQHNVKLGHHLMDCLKDNPNLKRVVFASSYLIYNPDLYQFSQPASEPTLLKESDPIYPRNLTGVAKLMHEIELRFLEGFKQVSFSSVNARIYRVYGKNSRDIISRWIRALLNNEPIKVYRKEGIFDYIYAGEVAEGLLRLAVSNASGIVNLGNGKARKVSEVVSILKQHFPDMDYSEEESDILFEASQADVTKLKRFTGWVPEKQVEDMIPALIAFEKKQAEKQTEKTEPFGNILITSVSKKIPLIESVRKAVQKLGWNSKIIGADGNVNSIAAYFTDDFWHMPLLTDLNVDRLVDYCKENMIKYIIPTRDGELLWFARNKDLLAKAGVHVMVSDEKGITVSLDKLTFAKELESLGLPVIPTSLSVDQINASSYVVKERFGAGSQNIGINVNQGEAKNHAGKLIEPIYQPFIEGQEISVDLFVGKNGKAKGVICRTRDLVVNGESQITTTIQDQRLEELAKVLVEKLDLYGHVVLQVIKDEKENYHIIECNARFGGASTLSINAGLDSFRWFLLESEGMDINDYAFVFAKPGVKMIRFASDTFIK